MPWPHPMVRIQTSRSADHSDFANDQHTLAGRKLGRGLDFREEGAKLIPEPTEPDLYIEEATGSGRSNSRASNTRQARLALAIDRKCLAGVHKQPERPRATRAQ